MHFSVVGHGSITIRKTSQSCVYTVGSGLIIVTNIINGYLRVFQKLVEILNSRAGCNIQVLPLDVSSLFSNAWFTGFIDADKSFQVRSGLIATIHELQFHSKLYSLFSLTTSFLILQL